MTADRIQQDDDSTQRGGAVQNLSRYGWGLAGVAVLWVSYLWVVYLWRW